MILKTISLTWCYDYLFRNCFAKFKKFFKLLCLTIFKTEVIRKLLQILEKLFHKGFCYNSV